MMMDGFFSGSSMCPDVDVLHQSAGQSMPASVIYSRAGAHAPPTNLISE